MRIVTTVAAVLALCFGAVTATAERGSVPLPDSAKYTYYAAEEIQREVCVVFPDTVAPSEFDKRSAMRGNLVSLLVLEDACRDEKGPNTDDPEPVGEDDLAFERRKLAAAFKAGLVDLKVTAHARKFTRVTAIAYRASCSQAMTLYRDGKIDCDQLILVDPVIEELPGIDDDAKPRAIDLVILARSDNEAVRERKAALAKLGPWGNSARLIRAGATFSAERVFGLFRLYQARTLKEELQNKKSRTTKDPTNVDMMEMGSAAMKADVIFVGELHGNPGAHRLQYELLTSMQTHGATVALSTEQFERDTQAKCDEFLRAEVSKLKPEERNALEDTFITESRAWPNYADYRPMVETCRACTLPLIAGNVPRRLAARINKEGPEAFEKFTTEEKAWCASKINAPEGAYKDKFFEVMGSSTGAKKDDKYAAMERMYNAQCLKDDTMAESIVAWLDKNKNGKVLHINGAFHSAGGLGVPEKLKALRPDLKIVVITCVEADNPFTAELDPEDAKGNDFVVFVPGSRPNRSNEGPAHPK